MHPTWLNRPNILCNEIYNCNVLSHLNNKRKLFFLARPLKEKECHSRQMTVREIPNGINEQSWFQIMTIQNKKKLLAERGFDPRTSGLWAQHASTAPLCY